MPNKVFSFEIVYNREKRGFGDESRTWLRLQAGKPPVREMLPAREGDCILLYPGAAEFIEILKAHLFPPADAGARK
jgi:hypothetical protein